MLTSDMKRIIEQQRLGFVATTAPDGTPNVSPKGTFVVVDEATIAFGEVRSPGTIRNLRADPRIEVNFVDLFVRKGYRFAGTANVVAWGRHLRHAAWPFPWCHCAAHSRHRDDHGDQGATPDFASV